MTWCRAPGFWRSNEKNFILIGKKEFFAKIQFDELNKPSNVFVSSLERDSIEIYEIPNHFYNCIKTQLEEMIRYAGFELYGREIKKY